MEAIKLNLIPTGALPVVHASQYDDGRIFRADLYDGAEVYHLDGTETISCELKKPDGNIVTLAVTNTSESFIEIQTTEQACAVAGESLAEVKIEKGADKIGSLNFILSVERSPIEGGISSASEIHNLETQVNQMVEDALATQYDSANVVFDNLPTAGHGIPYTVTSEGIGNAIDNALDMTDTASGAIATFESEYALPLRDLEIEINAVQASGTPTPSSPKAISGFTGANITVACNLLNGNKVQVGDKSVRLGELANNTYSTHLLATTYTISFTRPTSKAFRLDLIDSNNTVTTILPSSTPDNNVTFTVSTEGDYCFSIYLYAGVSLTDIDNVMLVGGSSVAPYEPYTAPTTYPITWQTEAGTIYGGSLNVTSGVLTVTHGSVDLGSLTWSNASGNLSSSSGIASDVKAPSVNTQAFNGLCSCYEVAPRTGIADNQISVQTNGNIVISDTGIAGMTGAQVETYVTGFVLVYELATPQTYQLTPTQISAIVGTNNVFHDCNGNTSLEYYSGNGEETARVAEEIAGVVVADYATKVVKTKNGTFTNLLTSPLNSVWLICCQKITASDSGFVGIYSFDGVNLNPCIVYNSDLSASFDSATGTIKVKYSGSTTDVYGAAFRLA